LFGKILVATDISSKSGKMICSLGELNRIGTKEVLLIHCLNVYEVGTLVSEIKRYYEPLLHEQKKMLQDLGFKVTAKIVLGLPGMEINRQACENNCSLIVVGSEKQIYTKEIFLGGVATSVIHNARMPVMILRIPSSPKQNDVNCVMDKCAPLDHVLFPTDFSDNAEHAYSYLKHLAASGVNKISLLHVQDAVSLRIGKFLEERLDEFNSEDLARLERMKEDLLLMGAGEVDIEVLYGNPKEEVLKKTVGNGISLVIMGSQGRSYLEEFFLGSVSHAVARKSEMPVVLIPHKQLCENRIE
jgi:nucleotide-binding universal stress UspA family protein